MCDRFVFQASRAEVNNEFEVTSKRDDLYESDFNISPGSLIPTIFQHDEQRKLNHFIWGLIPEGSQNEKAGADQYEIETEALNEDKWFTECIARRRCLIPASGFYKWKTTDKKNTPFYIRLLNNKLLAMGAIYSVWESASGRDVYSCGMLTTGANALIQPVDERMPVIIKPEDYERWMDKEPLEEDVLESFFKPLPMGEMAVNRVSDKVNNHENNEPGLIQPIPK